MKLDRKLFAASGLTQGELAWLCDTSRVTINQWLRHSGGIGPELMYRVEQVEKALRTAVDTGALPPGKLEKTLTKKYGGVREELRKILDL